MNKFISNETLSVFGMTASVLALNSMTGCNSEEPQKHPNVIILFADDLGYSDTGCYGAEGNYTPNIDKLADEGLRFTDFYVPSPVCSPSRAGLLTGCYPQRVGIPDVLAPEGPEWTKGRTNIGLNPNETTLPEMLKEIGYKTACIGKWHLGHLKPFLPTNQGFDMFYGLPYSNDMLPDDYPDLPLMQGDSVVEYNPDQSQLTKLYTEKALDFIEQNKNNPFFLYLPHTMPHIPIFASEQFKEKSGKGLYADVVMEIDWSVGEIMKALKKLNLDENTLVIFASDNGPWLEYGNHAGSAEPLREGKMTTFDGGQRVPCIMKWKGVIPEGIITDKIATTMDFLPTIASISRAKLPNVEIDGKNISPVILNDPAAKSPYSAFYYYNSNELQAVRSGKWKLHFPHNYLTPVVPGHDGSKGTTKFEDLPLSLFNLENDIEEKNNLADQYPELVDSLKQMALNFDAELKANMRPAGIVETAAD